MPNINTMFPSKWLKAADLPPTGATVTIAGVAQEEIEPGKTMWVLHFQGQSRGLVLNKTNGAMIAHIYGEETDGWAGKPILLIVEPVSFQGKIVDAIRVKPAENASQAYEAAAKADAMDDDIPF